MTHSPRTRHLVCLHHAGGSPTLFKGWHQYAAGLGVELLTPTLPGRASRRQEPLLEEPSAAVEFVLNEIRSAVSGPYHLFGHSLGGQLAYQVARHSVASGLKMPETLQVSAARPVPPFSSTHLNALSDADLEGFIRRLGGVPEELINIPAWRSVAFPILKSDLRLSSNLGAMGVESLDIPLTVHGGSEDSLVTASKLHAWSAVNPRMRLLMHNGSHFYLKDSPRAMSQVVDIVTSAQC